MIKKLYSFNEVVPAIYYDVIELMGEEALEAKLTAYDLLAVMAAPCTRLDYDNTDNTKRTSLMKAVHNFMQQNSRITNLTHQGLIKELNRSFVPMLTLEQQNEYDESDKEVFEGIVCQIEI